MYSPRKLQLAFLAVVALLLAAACSELPTDSQQEDIQLSTEMAMPPSPASSGGSGAASVGPNPFGNGTVYYTDANSFNPATPFYAYDVATDTWSQRASLPARNTTQLATDEAGNVYALPEDGNIYRYDPGTDTWNLVMAGPPAAVGRHAISFFEAHGGEFYWGDDALSQLWYTSGGVWSAVVTPRPVSSGAAVNRSTGEIMIRSFGQRGFFVFDPGTVSFPQVCDDVGMFENSRVGAYFDGHFYSRTADGNYFAYDVGTCTSTDTGVAPASFHAATGEDGLGNIYSNGWTNDIVFEVFHVPTNTLLRLADAPDIPANAHSTLVVVATVEITVDIDIKPGSDPNSINTRSRGVIPVAILGSDDFDVGDVDRSTLEFGPGGATPAHRALGHLEDVNGDGHVDLVSHYKTQDTGLARGDIEACVTGATTDGTPLSGCDSVRIVR